MKPWKLLILVLLISPKAYAQNLDISLFDDEQPQLGRQAAPLQEIRLTPPPLPNITVGLGDNTPTPVITMPVTQEPVSPSVPINLPPPTTGENAQPSSEQPAQVIPPHDVHGYDLKGFYLVMPMISVKNMLKSKGFTIKTIREDIPRFYTTDYEYKCRDEGVIIPEKVRACILNKARKENQAC